MTYNIRLHPSGRSYPAESRETLLEAGLRCGISLPYRCNNGNCGECLARLRQGEVSQLHHHDYVLSAAEKAERGILLCCHAAASDLEIEVIAARDSRDIPQQEIRVKVVGRSMPGPGILELNLRTPRSQSLRFLAGQHVQLIPDGMAPLDIAIASCPCNGMQLQFHLSSDHSHPTANYLFEQVARGDRITLKGPYGDFLLDETSARPVLLLAVGMGFASIKSLVEHIINLDLPQSIRLFWFAESPQQRYLENHCRSWASALDDYVYHPLALPTSKDLDAVAGAVFTGVQQAWPQWRDSDIYLSASSSLSAACRDLFLQQGGAPDRFTTKRLREGQR